MATSEHFSADELSCNHCGRGADIVSARLLELVEQLRYNCGGYPLQCNCAYRCPKHNAEVGGVPNSQHVLGTAMDIQCPSQLTIGQFKWYCEQLPFDGIGYYPWTDENGGGFIHVDVRWGGVSDSCNRAYWEC